MKTMPFLILSIIFVLLSSLTGQQTTYQTVGTVAELRDIQSLKYAGGLRDWKNRPVDSLVMDLFYPTGASSSQKYPLLLYCHAGGFTSGNRFNVSAITDEFAEEGFIVASIEYRTGYTKGTQNLCNGDTAGMMDAHYRAAQDVKACFRFLVANADLYHIDTAKLFIGGSSAGGSLAMESSYLGDSVAKIYFPGSFQRLGSLETSGNTLTNKYSIKGIVNLWGAIIRGDGVIKANYRAYPTIIFKGDEDGGIPDSVGHFQNCANYPIVYAGIAIYTLLQNANQDCVFHFLPGASHPAYDDQFAVKQASCYMRAIMAGNPYSGIYDYFNESCQ